MAAFPPPVAGVGAIIICVTLFTITLRLSSVLPGMATAHIFVSLSKQVTLNVRQALLDKLLGETITKVLAAVLSVIGVTAVLLWMHWQLALIILLLNPFVIALTMVLGKQVKTWKQRENTAFEWLSQSATGTLEAMQQLRASNTLVTQAGSVYQRLYGQQMA
ncbi:ABC transporter transmembrane domain-containing protein [Methylophilus rhizosphaerae]|uniref:ABC transporter transmembrane domain-containing protein n=1 Tax=Methylophilus rhizosphaerae TaxID=492660 RepID=UPI000ACA0926|nr:ABC transporter transmembrane domain-containing protein [Methylophilus rhizosphaerae]